jgi:hypothetical protein
VPIINHFSVVPSLIAFVVCHAVDAADGYAASGPDVDQASDLTDALGHGHALMSARYRYENVDQNSFQDEAHASTLRLSLGYTTKPFHGFSATAQYQGVFAIGNELYDDQPGYQGNNHYPLVNDPAGSELEQAFVRYGTSFDTTQASVKAGRQEIILNNQRFIGTAGWRQMWQTFDAVTAAVVQAKDLSITAGFIGTAHRVSGDDALDLGGTAAAPIASSNDGRQQMDSWFANAGYVRSRIGSAALYAVCLNYELPQAKGNNSATVGARIQGPYAIDSDWSIVYALEAARQTDYAHYVAAGITHYVAWYYQTELGVSWRALSAKLGWDRLQGSSAGDKFNTPLDSPHAFNGWAEQFVATPSLGLDARYLSIGGPVPPVRGLAFAVIGYRFYSQSGGFHYGDELDVMLEYACPALDGHLIVGTQIGDFSADDQHTVPAAQGGGPVSTVKASVYSTYQF